MCSWLVGCAAERPVASRSVLLAQRAAVDARLEAEGDRLIDALLDRVKAEDDAYRAGEAAEPPVVDMLIISGGGDWGAFGAGVLRGWGRVSDPEFRRPEFDVVTGVSTGALIAPFAFLGDEASIDRVVQIYRNPQRDWARPRGMFYFLPHHTSFATIPGLERELDTHLDEAMLRRLAATPPGRMLMVNTTNVDHGTARPWDLIAEARRALDGEPDRVHRILLASSAIPGAFPPRMIDGHLYVDGGITGNILYANRTPDEYRFSGRWRARYPDRPIPRQRFWVIFNNQTRFPPETTQPVWPQIVARSQVMATQAATDNAIRHLHAIARIARLMHDADVEVRMMSVPNDWVPPVAGVFNREAMNELADLGESMGADPGAWRTDPP